MRHLVTLIALFLAICASAQASGQDVIRDCTDDGRLQGSYTQAELRSAVANLPSDVEEYTDCGRVIRAAQRAKASGASDNGNGSGNASGSGSSGSNPGGGTSSNGSSSTPASGAEERADDRGSAAGDFGGFNGFQKKPLSNATAEERREVAEARTGDAAVRIPAADSRTAVPTSDVPLPLLIVLALLGAGVLVLGVQEARRRVVARRLP